MKHFLSVRTLLYLTALLAVLADSVLIPFYPQFFKSVYQEHSLLVTGIFIAVCRLAMIISFPFWSWLAQRIDPLKILIYTQGSAGILCMFCSFAGTLSHFFICALLVELFKSSYLLIYPHLVKTSSINNRAIAISGISIILNLGIVLSTLLGSYFIEYLQPSYIFILVGCMDILQMFISKSILSRNHDMKQESPAPVETRKKTADKLDFLFLCLITLFFYFAMVIIRPYYTLFLTSIYGNCINTTMAAFIFIIPNIIALGVAPFTAKFTSTYPLNSLLLGSCGLMIIGIGMQIFSGHALIIIAGRVLYGIGMFMSEVIVDIRVFNLSNNQNIYKWYSYINGVQNISILIAPLVAAFIISSYGQYPLFIMSVASTLIMSVLVFVLSAYKKKEFILQKN